MAQLNSAAIHCHECDCTTTYTGSSKVGNKPCDRCGHPLLRHQVDAQVGYALDSTGRMPEGFEIGAYFE